MGRFLTDSAIDFQAMQHKMASVWKPGRGMFVKPLEANRFMFQFYHEIDIKRVVEGSPWTFGRFHLAFVRLKQKDDPRTVPINTMDIWIQLHDMNPGFMSLRVVKDIGNYIGQFIESNINNFTRAWRDYLRVRVSISLDSPLKRRMKLKKNAEQWSWVNFKYEGAPTFCFICGLIGHSDKFCEQLFETPEISLRNRLGHGSELNQEGEIILLVQSGSDLEVLFQQRNQGREKSQGRRKLLPRIKGQRISQAGK